MPDKATEGLYQLVSNDFGDSSGGVVITVKHGCLRVWGGPCGSV
jgi:hypothetical protein